MKWILACLILVCSNFAANRANAVAYAGDVGDGGAGSGAVGSNIDTGFETIPSLTTYNPIGECDKSGGGKIDSDGKSIAGHTLEEAEAGKSKWFEVATAPKGTGGSANLHDKCFKMIGKGEDAEKFAKLIAYAGDCYAGKADQAKVKKAIGKSADGSGKKTMDVARQCPHTEAPKLTNIKIEIVPCPQDVKTRTADAGGAKAGT